MLTVTGIAFAIYPVTDIARARSFYEGALGLKPGMQLEFAPGQWWIEYDAGPSALAITNAPSPSGGPARTSGVALEVKNLDDALALVRAKDLKMTWGPNDFPVCRGFGLQDPDGNDLYLHQLKMPHA